MRTIVPMVLAVSLGMGCVTGSRSPSVLGRPVIVVPPPGADTGPVEGELIAVEPERIWVLGKEHVVDVPVATVQEIRVQRHSLDSKRGWAWTAVGAVVTGGALTLACTSVGDNSNCGRVFATVGATWLLFGGLPSATLDESAWIVVKKPDVQALLPYARFPQGPPAGLDIRQVAPKAAKPEEQ